MVDVRFTALLHWVVLFGLATAAGTLQAAEREVVRSFVVEPGALIAIDTYSGSISVTEAETNVVRIAVRLEIGADDEQEVENMLRTLELDFEAKEQTIRVLARRPAQTRARWIWNEDRLIEPTFRVIVPRQCRLQLSTRSGAITVGAIDGSVDASAEVGDVFVRHVHGSVNLVTGEGEAVVSRCEGDVRVRVGRGTLRVGTVKGRCDVGNASGDVEVLAPRGDLHASATAGEVVVHFPRTYTGRADVRTSGGGITARIDPAASCEVVASASFLAQVTAAAPFAPIAGKNNSRRLKLRLQDGSSRISLRTGGGDVRIEPGETLFE